MNMAYRKYLSKSRFLEGLQCEKRVHLSINHRDLATPPDNAQQAIFDQGTHLGELARQRWPDGHLVNAKYFEHDKAVAETQRLISDPLVEVIFEAGFTELGVRIRADVMVRAEGGTSWDLIEVKGSTGSKPVHDADIAIQTLVITTAGIRLRKKMLMAVDSSYVFDGDTIDVHQLFKLLDRTAEADAAQKDTESTLTEMHDIVSGSIPAVEPSPHCRKPYLCPFWEHCTTDVPDNWIMQLPRLSTKAFNELRERHIEDIGEIPQGIGLTSPQELIRSSVALKRPWISGGLKDALMTTEDPIYFLDFETFNPAVPIYKGTRPYERLPFQWSCHIKVGAATPGHAEFLATGLEDPRRAFAESLIAQLRDSGPVVVYSGFELGVIRDLENLYPDLGDELRAIAARIWDLLDVIRKNYYHPDFHGSYSIKSVVPALVPELAYKDLDIQSGDGASSAFQKLASSPHLNPSERERIESELKEYCARDTLAMVKILECLRSVASSL
jgi:hypothetical protein